MKREKKSELQISRFELHKVADFLPYPFIINFGAEKALLKQEIQKKS